MGKYYTDEQVQEVIAALESYSPGVWEKMKKMALVDDPLVEEHEVDQSTIVHALGFVLPKMPFVAAAPNKPEAQARLLIDVRRVIRAVVAQIDAKAASLLS